MNDVQRIVEIFIIIETLYNNDLGFSNNNGIKWIISYKQYGFIFFQFTINTKEKAKRFFHELENYILFSKNFLI